MTIPAQAQPASLDLTLDEDQANLLRAMLGDDPDEANRLRFIVGDGHSGHGLYVAEAECQDEGAIMLAELPPRTAHPSAEADDLRLLSKWLNEGSTAPVDRQALARVLASRAALAAQPAAPKLTDSPLLMLKRAESNTNSQPQAIPEHVKKAWLDEMLSEPAMNQYRAELRAARDEVIAAQQAREPMTDEQRRDVLVLAGDDADGQEDPDVWGLAIIARTEAFHGIATPQAGQGGTTA